MILKLDKQHEPLKTASNSISRKMRKIELLTKNTADEELSEYAKTTEVQALVANEATRATGVEGKLDDLETEANTNLVAAINEVNTNASNAQTAAGNASSKADATAQEVTVHTENTNIHVTTEEKAEWNNKQDALQYYTESTNSVVIGDTDTNATVTLKCGSTEVALDEAALIKFKQLLNTVYVYPENG